MTHKPSILGIVDNILLLRDGQVALCGPRDAVLAKLAEIQKRQREEAAKARLLHEELEKKRMAALGNEDAGRIAPKEVPHE